MGKRKTARHPKAVATAAVPPTEIPHNRGGQRTWRRRLAIGCTGLLLLLLAAWASGVLAPLAFAQADYQMMQRNHPDAIYWGQVASRLRGNPAHIEWLHARIERRNGDGEAMERHLRAALAKGLPQRQAELERALAQAQSGDLQSVAEELAEWMKDPGNHAADIADAYSLGLRASGRLAEAKIFITAWATDCPDDPKSYVELGRIAESEFRKQDAETKFRRAVEVNPNYPVALYALGQWLLEQKRPEEALVLLRRCSELDPRCRPAADILQAKCQRLLGDAESARALLAPCLRASLRELDKAYLRLSTHPKHGAAEFEMGMLEFDAQQYSQAAEYFRQTIRLAPQSDDAEYQLGLTLKRLGDNEASQQILQRVTRQRAEIASLAAVASRIATDPDDFEARFRMGSILMDNGRADSGLFHLNCVLAIQPGHLAAHQRLAEYYAAHQQDDPQYAALASKHRQWIESLEEAKP